MALSVAAGANLDYETQSSYIVRVRATDGYGMAATFDQRVLVTDANDMPRISFYQSGNSLAGPVVWRVREDAPVSSLIGNFDVIDDDSGDRITFQDITPLPGNAILPPFRSLCQTQIICALGLCTPTPYSTTSRFPLTT